MESSDILEQDIKAIGSDNNIPWEKLENKNVLVTGATGLIGSLIVKTLLTKKCNIIAMSRNEDKAKALFGDTVCYIKHDIRYEIKNGLRADYIIHCASNTNSKYMISNPVETIDISYRGTYNILSYAQSYRPESIIYVSSMEAYGQVYNTEPVTEDMLGYVDLCSSRSSYPEGKRICELLCYSFFMEYGLPVKSVRLAQTFGPGVDKTDNRVFMQFVRSLIDGKNIVLRTHGRSYSNFCYTTDTIRGIFYALLKGESGNIYNICNSKETRTISEIAEMVTMLGEGNVKVIYDIDENNNFGYAKDTMLHLSAEKIKKLGWEPQVSMIDAYKRLLAYINE